MIDADNLSPAEIKELRKLLQEEKHVTWFWITIRKWAAWLSVTIGTLYAVYLGVVEMLSK